MSKALAAQGSPHSYRYLNRLLGRVGSFGISAVAGFALTLASFWESLNSARLGAVIIVLFLLHLLRYPRFRFDREAALYATLVVYMLISLLWTDNVRLAMNTLVPAVAFVSILFLFSALATYHNLHSVLAGVLCGVILGSSIYSKISRFPFAYPVDFSYNAIAGMYLFGLFIALLFGCYRRSKLLLFVALLFFMLVLATTSIKFNLGIALGGISAGVIYFKHFLKSLGRNVFPLMVFGGALIFAVASSGELRRSVESGIDRALLGIQVLQARENVPGYSAFGSRARWQRDGLEGWVENPLFGHGVEAFRDRYGITSHSTPIDLLYNSGLIGFFLFYAILVSLMWRLFQWSRRETEDGIHALIFGTAACYLFISLSAPLHYSAFFAAFIAMSAAVLNRRVAVPDANARADSGTVNE